MTLSPRELLDERVLEAGFMGRMEGKQGGLVHLKKILDRTFQYAAERFCPPILVGDNFNSFSFYVSFLLFFCLGNMTS